MPEQPPSLRALADDVNGMLSTTELAKVLECSTTKVERLVAKKGLPCHTVLGVRRYVESEVAEWLARQITPAAPPKADAAVRRRRRAHGA